MVLTNIIYKTCLKDKHNAWHINLSKRFLPQRMKSEMNKLLPIKGKIFSWRIVNERLPTRINVNKRGIKLNSTRCPICGEDQESELHTFTNCPFTNELGESILDWWKLGNFALHNVKDMIYDISHPLQDDVKLSFIWIYSIYMRKIQIK